ncbi:predicted protein [Histoplasma capsulatum G186AR]|uniref:Uncharacterized protein n=1 Tax=Ajellomyces capsulatus (strain G186AR / H82 / ATCC MYA-2454 / RMSCC 2432) TaxID=447093 RepID=C0NFU5_AJECG|nr:uncharacterized protein HCBG_01761 [Histoplasma capsulatum G186AR]EEH10116.1 predicted protein [Histoplasma capsulatum G186AR]
MATARFKPLSIERDLARTAVTRNSATWATRQMTESADIELSRVENLRTLGQESYQLAACKKATYSKSTVLKRKQNDKSPVAPPDASRFKVRQPPQSRQTLDMTKQPPASWRSSHKPALT